MTTRMETLSEAIERLASEGWSVEFTAVDDGSDSGVLECPTCGRRFSPDRMEVHDQLRFEGTSDPDDMSILLTLTAPCGSCGVYTTMFGPEMTPEDAAVVRNLPR